MTIYIQLLKDTGILEDNVVIRRKAGEWLEVQRNIAIRLLIEGRARVLDYPALLTEYGDVAIINSEVDISHNVCDIFNIVPNSTALLTPRRLLAISDNNIFLKRDLISPITILTGLQALQNWHVAIPLSGRLISEYSSIDDINIETKSIIRDLRVPAYSPDIIFYRNSDHAKRWIDVYASQLQNSKSIAHALIRSLYITKPYHIALPAGSIR